MRFAYISCLYDGAIAAIYSSQPELLGSSYAHQLAAFFAEGLHWNGAWDETLPKRGYQVLGILSNVQPLQRAWCTENGLAWPTANWRDLVALEQLRRFSPEILFLDGGRFSPRWLKEVRSACPALKLVYVLAGAPAFDVALLRQCNAVLSCSRKLVETFRAAGCRAFHFRHAFNASTLSRLPPREPVRDEIFFAGGLVRGKGYHSTREKLVEQLANTVPLVLHTEKASLSRFSDMRATLARRSVFAAHRLFASAGLSVEVRGKMPLIGRAAGWQDWPEFQFNRALKPMMKPALFGLSMLTQMRHAAVALNMHIGVAGGYASNIRLYEATGVGACLLTDRSIDLNDFFDVDREVVAYSSAEECVEKARWLLTHPAEREAIARAGQIKTLRCHTYENRAAELDGIVHEALAREIG